VLDVALNCAAEKATGTDGPGDQGLGFSSEL
jgi:hypothetical protein